MRTCLCLLFLAAACRGETLLILHKRANSLGIYDGLTGRRQAEIGVGHRPHEIALSPDNKLVYVTDYGADRWTETQPGGNTISIVDLEQRKRTGVMDLGKYHRPHGIERGASGLYYVTVYFPPSLLAVDMVKRRIARAWDVKQELPHMSAVMRNEKKAYVINAGSGTVTVLNLVTGEQRHIQIGGIPMGVDLSPDERTVYATTRTGNSVALVDTATDRLLGEIKIPGQPVRMSFTPNGRYLLVTLIDAGETAVVDVASRKVVRRFPTGSNSEGVQTAGEFGYVSAQADNKVVKFSLATWKPVLEIATGERPDPIVVLP